MDRNNVDAVPDGNYRCAACDAPVHSLSHDPYREFCNECWTKELTPEEQLARIEAGGYKPSPMRDGHYARFGRQHHPPEPKPRRKGKAPACTNGCLGLGLDACVCADLATISAMEEADA